MVSKKHFKSIADIINDATILVNDVEIINKEELVTELCRYFRGENPRFDTDKFRDACSE